MSRMDSPSGYSVPHLHLDTQHLDSFAVLTWAIARKRKKCTQRNM